MQRSINRLKELFLERGKPKTIRTDNGPEFISKAFKSFCKDNNIRLQFIQPGKPDVLDAYLFESLTEVNALAFEWQMDYNQNHPHQALNRKSPWIYINEIMNLIIN